MIKGRLNSARENLGQANWLKISLFTVTAVLGVLYIWQVNVSATQGFAMRDLEEAIDDLQLENERYGMEVARLQSIDSVTARVQMLGLTKVEQVEYLTIGEPTVAINR